MLSLFETDQIHGWATRLHRLQQNPFVVFGATVGAILLASLIRWALGGLVQDRIPFTTYYPAIVVATLLGGFWLGMLASMLSVGVGVVYAPRVRRGANHLTHCLHSGLHLAGRSSRRS